MYKRHLNKWSSTSKWNRTRKKSVLITLEDNNSITTVTDPKPFNDIPGPRPSIPLLGHGWQYFRIGGRYNLFKLHEANVDKYRRYGRIVKEEYEWRRPIVQVFDPEDFEAVFRHQGKHPVRPIMEFVCKYRSENPEKYDSPGLANSLGEEWSRLRTGLSPVLNQMKDPSVALTHLSEIGDDLTSLIQQIKNPSNTIDDIQDLLYRVALECIFAMCLNKRLGCLDQGAVPLRASRMIEAAKNTFEAYQELYYGTPRWKRYKTPAYKKLDNAECEIHETVSSYMDEALRKGSSSQKHGPVLDSLLSLACMSDKEKKLTIVDFILGGVFTVTNSLCYLLHNLARNKEVQEKVYEEISSICSSGAITNEQMGGLKYLKACVKESFRISPTVPGIMRILPNDVTLSGYNVPAGTPIFCHFMVTCKLEKYFDKPDKFIPERWLRDIGNSNSGKSFLKSPNPFTLLPFGHGSRMCAGRTFSQLELCVATAKIVQSFKIECFENSANTELDLKHDFIVVPSKPIALKFIGR